MLDLFLFPCLSSRSDHSPGAMAAKLIKLELLYGSMGKRVVVRTIFFAMALAAMPVLYVVQDPSPCDLSDYPDDCMGNFRSSTKLPFRKVSLLSFSNNQNQPEVSKLDSIYKPRPSGGPGVESHAQKKIWTSKAWRQKVEFYSAIFQKLSERGLLRPGFKALCVGAGSGHSVLALRENGLPDAIGIDRKSFAPLVRKGDINRLPFAHDSFNFIFSASFDRALVPALLVSEIERTLKTGGFAVMLISPRRLNVGNAINPFYSLSPVVALFRNSDVVHVTRAGSPDANDATIIVLCKRPLGSSKPLGFIHEFSCSKQNRSLVKLAEPLTMDHSNAIYLPTVKDIRAHKRHIYVEIGGKKNTNTLDADSGWFMASYPKQNQSFCIYDLTLNSPGLSSSVAPGSLNSIKQAVGDGARLSSGSESGTAGLDIAGWLSEMSVSDDDFVIVKMGFENVTREMIREMIDKSGTGFMCLIDELFLQCSSSSSQDDYSEGLLEEVNGECLQFLQTLRDHGVFVHRW